MIIKEVTIENFRSYYGSNTIKFSDGFMLFVGGNGDGKTTFFEALEWLFDTSKQNKNHLLISKKKIAELTEFESDVLKVAMTFNHDGKKIIEKSFSFKKDSNNDIITSDFQFKGFEDNGVENIPIQGGILLDRCFEAAIRKYCLFKGEKNLNVFNNSDALNYLIDTFSNISQFDPYFTGDDDDKGFTDYSEELSRRAYEKAMRADKKNSREEKEISFKLQNLRNKLSEINERLKNNQKNAAKYSSKLDEIESSKEASSLIKNINERLQSLKKKRDNTQKLVNENYTFKLLDDMWILCGFSSIFDDFQKKVSSFSHEKRSCESKEDKKRGKQELAAEISNGIIPLSPNVPDKISMQEMIVAEWCKVCNRPAEKDSDAYNYMVNKLNTLIKNQQPKPEEEEKPLFQNNYLKELEQKSNYIEYNQDIVNNLVETIKADIEFNESRKAEENKIQEQIDIEEENKKKVLAQNDTLTEEQLENTYENISNWWECKSQAETQIGLLEKEKKEIEKNLEEIKKDYDNLAKNSAANTYSKIHILLEKVQKAFKNAKEKNTTDFLELLEQKASNYLEELNVDDFHGVIRIISKPDRTAKITLQDQDGILVDSPNQALETSMYMSILFAVSELTTIKNDNDYPLIFDAPTYSFEPQKVGDFYKIISTIKKQCVIFTTNFIKDNGELDHEKVNSLNGTIFRIEKKQPFDTNKLETIQTEIKQIKKVI